MKDQVDNLLSHGIRAYFLHSGLTKRENRLVLDKCRLGKVKILYLPLKSCNHRHSPAN